MFKKFYQIKSLFLNAVFFLNTNLNISWHATYVIYIAKFILLLTNNFFLIFQHDTDLIFDDLIDSNSLPNGVNPLSSPSLSHEESHNHSRSRTKRRIYHHHHNRISDDEDLYRDAEDGPSGFFPDESGDFEIPRHVDRTGHTPDTRVPTADEGPCKYCSILLSLTRLSFMIYNFKTGSEKKKSLASTSIFYAINK